MPLSPVPATEEEEMTDAEWKRQQSQHIKGECGEDCIFCEKPMDDLWFRG